MNAYRPRRLFIVTGGPGSGKTALIAELAQRGWESVEEAGRRIIREEVARGGRALPWDDRELFADRMLECDVEAYRAKVDGEGPVIFDRGIPDVIGYLTLEGLPVADHIRRAARTFRYQARAFICPPWPEIFAQDSERRQTPEVAESTHAAMVATYGSLGYELIEVPRASVGQRADFVIDTIGA